MSNRFTKYTADKLRLDGWLDKEQADHLRTQLKSVEAERDGYKHEAEMWDEHMGPLTDYEGDEAPWQTIVREFENLRDQRDKVEADAAVMRGLLARSKDVINEVAAFGNCDCDIPKGHKCVPCECGELFNEISAELITHHAGKSLLERLQEAEWLVVNCPNSCDPEPAVFKEWWNRRDAFLNPKPQDVM